MNAVVRLLMTTSHPVADAPRSAHIVARTHSVLSCKKAPPCASPAPITAVLACLIGTARADIPPLPDAPDKTTRSTEAPLILAPGAKDDPQMYVRLPRNLWQQWHADASRDGSRYAFGSSRGSTIVAGVSLTLSLSLAGLWLLRGRQRRILGGAALGLGVLVLLGVSGCPWRWPEDTIPTYNEPLAPPIFQADGSLKGEALLQLDEKSSSIQVVVPPKELAMFARSQSEK